MCNGKSGGSGRGRSRKRSRNIFYSPSVSEEERAELPEAMTVEGLDEEIALLRVRVRKLIKKDPENTKALFRGMGLLVRAVRAKHMISGKKEEKLPKTVSKLLKQARKDFGLKVADEEKSTERSDYEAEETG